MPVYISEEIMTLYMLVVTGAAARFQLSFVLFSLRNWTISFLFVQFSHMYFKENHDIICTIPRVIGFLDTPAIHEAKCNL